MRIFFRKVVPAAGLALILTAGLALSGCTSSTANPKYTSLVDQYIGTGGHGHVFMGANVPYGLVQLGPTQFVNRGWDWVSGYHYSDSTIVGFGHMHLSGTGIGDLGDVSVMPLVGEVPAQVSAMVADESRSMYSLFSHENESFKPGYYSVKLDRYNIGVELTATTRCGFHKYTFPAADDARLIFDLERGIGWDTPYMGSIELVNDTTIVGFRQSYGWANRQEVYFVANFSKPIKDFKVYQQAYYLTDQTDSEGRPMVRAAIEDAEGTSIKAPRAYAQLLFGAEEGEAIYVKVGISPVSIENAKENLATEIPAWDFDKVVADATSAWEKELGKIEIETSDESIKKIFYTAMYHTLIAPSIFNDVNGDYMGADYQVHNADHNVYTTFSLWDTYRAAHPLMSIIRPEINEDIAKTFTDIYRQQGKLPVWHLVGNETDCMIGNPGVPVLGDLVLKGYDIDAEAAFEAMKNSMLLDERGLGLLKEYGYIPYDKEATQETVAKGLEYALADWSVAQVAKKLGKEEDYEFFLERSKSYKNYFDPQTEFMRGVSSTGEFREPFDPFHSTHRQDDYTEGNAWQYTWLVPHDVHGLVSLFPSEAAFVSKLDSLFLQPSDLGEEASPDISGLIGQYAHGNEPSHHVLYMYNYVGQPWKGAEKIREVMRDLYHAAPDGLSGNEDVGQMSAWYIMSAVGLYQVEPAGGKYIFGSPVVDKAKMYVGENKTFEIVAHNNSAQNIYIQSVKLNGEDYTKSYIDHADVAAGGKLEFFMGSAPSDFGTALQDRP